MVNKPHKRPELLTGHRSVQSRPLPAGGREGPPPPLNLPIKPLVSTVRTWERMWSSRVANLWDENSDIAQLEHLAWCIDERNRARRAFSRKRIVEDSKGRLTLNPLRAYIKDLDRTIAQIGERVGLTPLDRMRLGLTHLEGQGMALDLNRLLADDQDEADDDGIIDLDAAR